MPGDRSVSQTEEGQEFWPAEVLFGQRESPGLRGLAGGERRCWRRQERLPLADGQDQEKKDHSQGTISR